jgi:hypothetical protein
MTFFSKNGCINVDGSNYLRLAKSLVEGNGFRVLPPSVKNLPNERFFSMWPVGYSLLTAGIAKITFLPVYWASKVVNILVFSGIQFLFHKIYGREGGWLSLVFLLSLFLEISIATLSGLSFIGLFVLTVFTLHRYFTSNFKTSYLILLVVFATSMLLIRYIGVVVIPILLFFLFVEPNRLKFGFNKPLTIPFLTIALLHLGYFALNFYLNQDLPNGPYYSPHISLTTLMGHMLWEVFHQTNFLFSVLYKGPIVKIISTLLALFTEIFILYFVYSYLKPKFKIGRLHPLSTICLVSGLIYLFTATGIYFFKPYDYSYRILVPFSLMIVWFVYNQFYVNNKRMLRVLQLVLLSFAVMSITVNGVIRTAYHGLYKDTPFFLENLEAQSRKYKEVEEGSVVLFPSVHLNYLRIDIVPLLHLKLHTPNSFENSLPTNMQKIYIDCERLPRIKYTDFSGSPERISEWEDQCKETTKWRRLR